MTVRNQLNRVGRERTNTSLLKAEWCLNSGCETMLLDWQPPTGKAMHTRKNGNKCDSRVSQPAVERLHEGGEGVVLSQIAVLRLREGMWRLMA